MAIEIKKIIAQHGEICRQPDPHEHESKHEQTHILPKYSGKQQHRQIVMKIQIIITKNILRKNAEKLSSLLTAPNNPCSCTE